MATPLRHFRAPDEMWQAVTGRAERDGTTASAVVLAAVREYLSAPHIHQCACGERWDGSTPQAALARPAQPAGDHPAAGCRHPSGSVLDGVCQECGEYAF